MKGKSYKKIEIGETSRNGTPSLVRDQGKQSTNGALVTSALLNKHVRLTNEEIVTPALHLISLSSTALQGFRQNLGIAGKHL